MSAYHAGLIIGLFAGALIVGLVWAGSRLAFVRSAVKDPEIVVPTVYSLTVVTLLHDWTMRFMWDWRFYALAVAGAIVGPPVLNRVRR